VRRIGALFNEEGTSMTVADIEVKPRYSKPRTTNKAVVAQRAGNNDRFEPRAVRESRTSA
jgi:hypothetical protein